MAKKNSYPSLEENVGTLVTVFAIVVAIFAFLFKWIVKFFKWIFTSLSGNKNDSSEQQSNNDKKTYTLEIKNYHVDDNKFLKSLNLFDMSIYSDIFEPRIITRGEDYFFEDRIKNFKNDGNKYTCKVSGEGNNIYNVSIEFEDNSNDIHDMTCTCPYFEKYSKGCKHIYALLYKIKSNINQEELSNQKEKIRKEIIKCSKNMLDNLEIADNYINENILNFKNEDIRRFRGYKIINTNIANNYQRYAEDSESATQLLKYLKDITFKSSELKESIDETMATEDETLNNTNNINNNYHSNKSINTNYSSVSNSDDNPSLLSTIIALSNSNKPKDDASLDESNGEYTKRELMDVYGLEDWQADLVLKGEYDPWNFEEEDLEEDDYYYDDQDDM